MHLPGRELFQKHRIKNRRNMVIELRILLEPADLNYAESRTVRQSFFGFFRRGPFRWYSRGKIEVILPDSVLILGQRARGT